MKKVLLVGLVFVFFISCKNEQEELVAPLKSFDQIEDLKWLIGNWTDITKE